MSTCRDVIANALGFLGAVGPGESPTADELDLGLSILESLLLEVHEARGPLRDVDVTADLVAGEDQRLRVQAGSQVTVTLPNSVPAARAPDFAYGSGQACAPAQGSLSPADGVWSRPPRDGARVEIVGVSQQLFFYRADANAWQAASPLALDGPTPLNGRYDQALAAMLAGSLLGPLNLQPDLALSARIARANVTLMLRPGTAREPLRLAAV